MNDFTKMGSDEIGEFCRTTHRKMAKDVYALAKAIQVVYLRLKGKGKKGEFKAWRDQYVPYLSKATVYRYLNVAELDPAEIMEGEKITELYRRFFILPAKPPATTPPTTSSVARSTTVGGNRPQGKATESMDEMIRRIASQPGAKKQGLTPAVLTKMPEQAIKDMAKQLQSPSGQPAGVTDGHPATQVSELRAFIPDEDLSPEEAEARRMSEHADALVIAGEKAKPFPSLVNADPKDLLAYLGEFGVRLEDIAAQAAA